MCRVLPCRELDHTRPARHSLRVKVGRFAIALPLALLLLALVAVPLRILDREGLPRYRALSSELRELRASNAATRREVRVLKGHVERLRVDPSAVERIARDELGMVRQGEFLFQFER